MKVNYKASGSLLLQGSYVFSKILTNADNFAAGAAVEDQANPGLEKAVGSFDQSHMVRMNTVYQLPVGVGHRLRLPPWFGGPRIRGMANQRRSVV